MKIQSSKKIAVAAMTTSLLIGVQLALSGILSVEVVTVIFCAYCCVFSIQQCLITATAYSLLRCFIFGFFPSVILLYLIYFNGFALFFSGLKNTIIARHPYIILTAGIFTCLLTLIDNLITPLMYLIPFKPYFVASLPVMAGHSINAMVSVGILFVPIYKLFFKLKKTLIL